MITVHRFKPLSTLHFTSAFALAVFALGTTASDIATARDRRVVDVAEVGNARSEAAHGYADYDAISGTMDGRPHRQARGWMHFSLKTFEDTDVTVSCTFAGIDTVSRSYDIVVEDSVIATRTLKTQTSVPTVVDVAVPFSLTKGKTNIVVVIRARGGLTPALRELRTIQDHYEVDLSQNPHGVTR